MVFDQFIYANIIWLHCLLYNIIQSNPIQSTNRIDSDIQINFFHLHYVRTFDTRHSALRFKIDLFLIVPCGFRFDFLNKLKEQKKITMGRGQFYFRSFFLYQLSLFHRTTKQTIIIIIGRPVYGFEDIERIRKKKSLRLLWHMIRLFQLTFV